MVILESHRIVYYVIIILSYLLRYCSPCKAHRQGEMRAWFYRLPDVLIIHIKRFNMTARWREKIRTKVIFPLQGLDMSEFMAG